jgi:hypothetical protein
MKKEIRDQYYKKSSEILSWYEEEDLTKNKGYLFVKDIIDPCFLTGQRSCTDKMIAYLDMIYEQGKPVNNNKEVIEELAIAAGLASATQSQKSVLNSLREWCLSGNVFSEKQKNLAKKLIREVNESQALGVWNISDDEKDDLFKLLMLSRSYSQYYLAYHASGLNKALDVLTNEVSPKIIAGQSLSGRYKITFEFVKQKLKKKVSEYKNPQFQPGQIVFIGSSQQIGTIISGPDIKESGHLVYEVFQNLQITKADARNIKKKIK